MSAIAEIILNLLAKLIGPLAAFFAGRKEAQNEAAKEENEILVEGARISDRIDRADSVAELREKLNSRP